MNTTPLISILIPMYNSEKTILRTLKSLPIDSNDVNVFVFDDGSSDDSLQLCARWAKEHQGKVSIIHSGHIGISEGRKKLAESATGLFTLYVDSDDYLDTNAFIKVIGYLRNNTCLDLISMPYKRIGQNEEEIIDLEPETLPEFTRNVLLSTSSNLLQTKIIKTTFLKKAQFNPSVSIGEDKLILASIVLKLTNYKKLDIPAPIVDIRSSNSLSRKKPSKCLFSNLTSLFVSLSPIIKEAGLYSTEEAAKQFWHSVGEYSAKAVKNKLLSKELFIDIRMLKNTEVYNFYNSRFRKIKQNQPLKRKLCMILLGL